MDDKTAGTIHAVVWDALKTVTGHDDDALDSDAHFIAESVIDALRPPALTIPYRNWYASDNHDPS